MTRVEAAEYVAAALRNPLALMSKPDRDRIYQIAEEHQLTAIDLLDVTRKRARNT